MMLMNILFHAPNLGGTRVDDGDHFHLYTILAGQPHPVKLHCLSSFLKFKSVSSIEGEIEMVNHECCLAMDAWMREAQEATELVEDVESRIKNRDLAGENRLGDFARSKLIEAGVKLDRLESLLHNPPSKPALTKEDFEFRWKMLLDLQLRTRALALCLYASTKRAGGFLVSETSGTSRATSSIDQDQKRKLLSKFDPELLTLLIPEDTAQDQVQEGVLDLLFDSWSSCPAICPGYNLRSNIIPVHSFLFHSVRKVVAVRPSKGDAETTSLVREIVKFEVVHALKQKKELIKLDGEWWWLKELEFPAALIS
ncbi:hypothetical protein OIU77_004023 [Salix suchowensis]|uniref:Uncharacterized protein n=1 Tax=Salix suchowensis TaxID=1278906 RepID=A0ABQ9AU78_9ROSI|nr:hypothetical protein OIU77_004023 [Salix suchowensis]